MSRLTKTEQETVINFNVAETEAVVYTRDRAVMRKLDSLVTEFPSVYRCVKETDIDKTYVMPKNCISYRGKRHLNEAQREAARERINKINKNKDT